MASMCGRFRFPRARTGTKLATCRTSTGCRKTFCAGYQHGRDLAFNRFRPQATSASPSAAPWNLIPAIGAYAALLKADGQPLHFPGGAPNLTEGLDADLLARAIAWAGDSPAARDEAFNITNGDVFVWQEVWPAIADALGMRVGAEGSRCRSLPRCRIGPPTGSASAVAMALPRRRSTTSSACRSSTSDFVLGHADALRGDPALVSTVKLRQAGFSDCIDTEAMLHKWFRLFQEKRFLPPA